jgi:nucleoside-diphosphate-sugar epimerase
MLGSFVVREVQNRGQEVRVLARASSLEIARGMGVEVFLGDLGDAESLRQVMVGVSGVIHVACTMRQESVAIDISAMRALLQEWDQGAFVYISSVDVYGYPDSTPVTEAYPLQPASGYGRGKAACERLLLDAAALQGRKDCSILRPPHIWGPHPKALQWIAADRVFLGLPVVLPGVTEAEWSEYGDAWIDARELAWIAAECLERPLGEAANAINSHFTWHEFFGELIHQTGSPSIVEHRLLETIDGDELPEKSFYAQTWRYSGEHLEKRLGFRHSRRWQDTLAEIVAAKQ